MWPLLQRRVFPDPVSYLNYPNYWAKGCPIATGVMERACQYLMKDRMETAEARWGLAGGEAVFKLFQYDCLLCPAAFPTSCSSG